MATVGRLDQLDLSKSLSRKEEAKELGLIGHVVEDGQALEKAHELAGLIAANGPLAVQSA